MNVVVDTSVWSLALRRCAPLRVRAVDELEELIKEGRVVMLGPIRQEILSGIKTLAEFERVRSHLDPFPDLELVTGDYEEAARNFNRARSHGVHASNTDLLICAAATSRKLSLLTTDRDFESLAKVLPLVLHQPRA